MSISSSWIIRKNNNLLPPAITYDGQIEIQISKVADCSLHDGVLCLFLTNNVVTCIVLAKHMKPNMLARVLGHKHVACGVAILETPELLQKNTLLQ